MPLRRRVKRAETFRFAADVLNQALHLVVKTSAEFGINLRVVIAASAYSSAASGWKACVSPPDDFANTTADHLTGTA